MDTSGKSLIEKLIFITASLIDVMTREIEFLKNMQPSEIRDLQREKADLAHAYEACMTRIKARPDLLAETDSALKRQLKDLTQKFQAVLADNERALRAVKSVSERLLNVIINAVAEKQNGAAYSSSGTLGAAALTGNGRTMPLTVNERL